MDLSGQTGNQKPLPLSFLCGWGRFWVRWWFRALGGRYVGGTNGETFVVKSWTSFSLPRQKVLFPALVGCVF